jgi:hypothetical protein
MVRRKKDRWQKYSSRAEKRPKVDWEEIVKINGSLEKFVVVKSVKAIEENIKLIDHSSAEENGNAVVWNK